jgi:hypothetical protein
VDPYSRLFSAVGNPTIVSRAEGKGQRAKERVEVRRYKGIRDTLNRVQGHVRHGDP